MKRILQLVPTFIIGDTVAAGILSKENLEQIIHEEKNKQKLSLSTEGITCGIDGC
ncbi:MULTISPECIES: hypothetical protein [unclassified Bacillus (in: firmicutes)]|uniref:hypothetical protein n=1 Tax=unclassified Bacillus (in: firmicutes) TaxID=185979 RepID=UPI001596C0FA|nr:MULTISPECIES: hypothetical protein [unclassified Bacillus (in: firmicutes)]